MLEQFGPIALYETEDFIVETWRTPLVSRTDGGHIVIRPKRPVVNRWDFDKKRAKELMQLSMIVGEAMTAALNARGVSVERLNIQDNANWAIGTKLGPKFHLHLFGRARNAVRQKRGESLYFPDKKTRFWKDLEPLSKEDIQEIVTRIKRISRRQKYTNW